MTDGYIEVNILDTDKYITQQLIYIFLAELDIFLFCWTKYEEIRNDDIR